MPNSLKQRIQIQNKKTERIRVIENYTTDKFGCEIVCYTGDNPTLLAFYECVYTFKSGADKIKIELPSIDIRSDLEVIAPIEWSICENTEYFPDTPLIKTTFNIYKYATKLNNKRLFDVKILDILLS